MSRRVARFPTVKVTPTQPETVAARTRRPVPAVTRSPSRDGSSTPSQSPLLGWPLVSRKSTGLGGGGGGGGGGSGSNSPQIIAAGAMGGAAALEAHAHGKDDLESDSSPLPSLGDSESSPTTPAKGRAASSNAGGTAALNTRHTTNSPTSALDFPSSPASAKKKTVNSWDPPRLKVRFLTLFI